MKKSTLLLAFIGCFTSPIFSQIKDSMTIAGKIEGYDFFRELPLDTPEALMSSGFISYFHHLGMFRNQRFYSGCFGLVEYPKLSFHRQTTHYPQLELNGMLAVRRYKSSGKCCECRERAFKFKEMVTAWL